MRHYSSGLGLPTHSGVQRGHRGADFLGVTRGVGGFQRLGGVQHHAVSLAQRTVGPFTLQRLAVEGFVDGLAEGIPKLLLELAFKWHALRLGLPAVLKRLDGIDVQHRGGPEHRGFLDHGLATRQAVLLRGLQGRGRGLNGLLP